MILSRDPLADTETLIRRVYGYVARRVGDGPNAEDLTSEVFERALRYRSSYDHRKGKPIVWLIGIARHCVDDHLGSPVLQSVVLLEDDPALVDPRRFEDGSVSGMDTQAGLAELGQRDQELIALRYGADLTARQIAGLLDVQTNAVEVSLHRALGRLRAILERPAVPVARLATASR
jgi:RNA polymerase sigma-70 factor, ECF subfamily